MAPRTINLNSHDQDGVRRLARHVEDRIVDPVIGLTHREIEPLGGPSHGTMTSIRGCKRTTYARSSMLKLCKVLQWRGDSVDRIAQGQDPVPLEDEARKPPEGVEAPDVQAVRHDDTEERHQHSDPGSVSRRMLVNVLAEALKQEEYDDVRWTTRVLAAASSDTQIPQDFSRRSLVDQWIQVERERTSVDEIWQAMADVLARHYHSED